MLAILSLLLGGTGLAAAPEATADGNAAAVSPWGIDLSGAVLIEAWDYNAARESLAGGFVGVDRHVWGPLAARGEGLWLRVAQQGEDAWLRGFTIGSRARWRHSSAVPFLDIGVGLSSATARVPIHGTTFNYLATLGGGVEIPVRGIELAVGARWLHVSNNGREGRARNPDIQSIGVLVGVGWKNVF